MPFRSKAQMRKFAEMVKNGDISEEKFQQWLDETGSISKLPERIGKRKIKDESPQKKEKTKSINSKRVKNKKVYMSGGRNKTKR